MKKLLLYTVAIILYSLPSLAQTHFAPAFEGNGQDHMNINILEASIEDAALEAGDEIAVFDGEICCGVFTLESAIDISNASTFGLIAASKSDDDIVNGYSAGNKIIVKFWDTSEQKEYTASTIQFINPQSGDETNTIPFTPNSSAFVKVAAINEVFIYDEIVECDNYTWIDGVLYDKSVDSLAFKYNEESDTTYILKLTINQSEATNLSKTICEGLTILIGEESFDKTGNYQIKLTNQFGCDSIVNLELNVNQKFVIENTTIYNVSDPNFEEVNSRTLLVETINFLSQSNCDSVIHNYETYNFVPEYFTDTTFIEVEVFDTTYVSVIDTLIIDIETGIDGLPLPQAIQLKMYPNPAHTELRVNISNWEILAGYSISIYNLQGQEIVATSIENSEVILNVASFEKGAYLVNIQKNGEIIVNRKLIIK